MEKLRDLVLATHDVRGIEAYKIGLELVIPFGAARIARCIMDLEFLPFRPRIIYDHQKAGNDIPDLGAKFASALVRAGVDAAILFPFSGPATQSAWIKACQDAGLTVLVGGHMTHAEFLQHEGGYIADDAPAKIYELAVNLGVRDFVVPGNKTESVLVYRELLKALLGDDEFTLYAPGFITQGGDISAAGKVAGDRWHAIVGSALYNQEGVDAIREAALRLTQQIQVAL